MGEFFVFVVGLVNKKIDLQLQSITTLSSELRPFGKVEPQQGQETDDEDVNDESEDETDDANEEEDMVLEPNDLQITYSPTTEMAANEATQS